MTNAGRLGALALALAVLALARPVTTHTARAASPAPPLQRVTLITDSVGGVLYWAGAARDELARGLDLRLETRACRKLVDVGCWAYGEQPPSALDTIRSLGAELGPLVVIDVGYNDRPDEYAADLDTVMQALVAAGVQRVIWVTLEETEDPWIGNNAAIREAPKRWPQLVVADWAPVAAANPSWFVDKAHMNYDGAFGFARFLRPIVLATCGSPCAPPPPPPPVRPRTRMLVPNVGTRAAVLRWLGNSAARTFDVALHPATGRWRDVASRLAARTYRLRGHPGELLLVRVRARDGDGRAGPWTEPQPIRFRRG
jgi:hypothetical protein